MTTRTLNEIAYLQVWTEGVDSIWDPDEPLDHTASNQFRAREVAPGDWMYVGYIEDGRLFLLARMQVAAVLSQDEAEKRLNEPLWKADDHLVGVPGTCTPITFDREVPRDVLQQLRFAAKAG